MHWKWTQNRLWTVLLGAASAVVVVLVVLVAVGVLRSPLPSSSSGPSMTVSAVHWHILEGPAGSNLSTGWFGPSEFNYTASEGYPVSVGCGRTFTVALVISDLGGQSHTVYGAGTFAGAPFSLVSVTPALPVTVPAGLDNAVFQFTFLAPSQSGESLPLNVTVNSLGPGS